MSNFKDSPKFSTHDDYYTPKSAWQQIQHLIQKKFGNSPTIYECFLLNSNGQSKKYLKELGYKVLGDTTHDFLRKDQRPDKKFYDLILSNPPFARIRSYKQRKSNLKYKCIKALVDNNKPFIILMNSTNIFQKWFKEIIEPVSKYVKFIFPSKKIQYDKYEEGGIIPIKAGKGCSFNSIYVSFKVLKHNEWI